MMKKLLVCLFILNGFVCIAQEDAFTWDYSVKPGTEEWKKFESRLEMAEACIIPETILNDISTLDLLELCLKYPLIHDIMSFNFPQMGFEHVSGSFNGFSELFKRQDVGSVLIDKYLTFNAEQVQGISTSLERGFFIASLSLFELILSQEEVISKLTEDEKEMLINEACKKFTSKVLLAKNYGLWGVRTTPLLMGRIMKIDQFSRLTELVSENESVANYLETGSSYDFKIMSEITDKAQEYLNLYSVFSNFSPPDGMPTPNFVYDVYTPKGLAVFNYASSTSDVATFAEMTQDNISYCNTYFLTPYPNATVIEYSTHKYNCHGYAWHYVEHNGEERWICVDNPATVKAYMYGSDKSYIRTALSGANKKVYYKNNDHSAVVTNTIGIVRSKWGPGPLVEHAEEYCSYYSGAEIEYWTINPDISGSRNKLCEDNERQFTQQSITHLTIDDGHSWDATGYLTETSGTTGSSFWVKANSQIGTGQIELTVTTPSGNVGTTTLTIDVNCQPDEEDVYIIIDEQGGGWVNEVCPNTNYHLYITNDDSNCSTSGYSWDLPSGWTKYYSSSNMIYANSGPSPEGLLEISATTVCGSNIVIFSEIIPESDNCGYYMMFSPNPATDETMLELKSYQPGFFNDDIDWELDIFDQNQILKEKAPKLKDTQYNIQTSDWKDGIYYVRVNLKGIVKTGVLIVTK